MSIFDRRILLVTGKGGVGKTTVSVALALAAARRGLKVALCETQGSTSIPPLFDKAAAGYDLQELAPRIHTLSITSESAIEDYILQQLRFKRLYHMVFRNRIMGPFVDAVPGLHDLIQLGKVWDLERMKDDFGRPRWDLMVVDAPATGHGATMLAAPRAMMDLTVAGPFHENAKLIADLYEDTRRVNVVLVSLPDDLPVNETLELNQRIRGLRSHVGAVVLNEMHPAPLPNAALYAQLRPGLWEGANPPGRAALGLVDRALLRQERQRLAQTRLAQIAAPQVTLPFLGRRDLKRADIETLSTALEAL